MATVITDSRHYSDIAAKIREVTGEDSVYKPAEMVSGVEAVSEKAYENGYNEGLSDGEQSETDRFWEAFQQGGTRTDYSWAFRYWNMDYIRPKYKIQNFTMKIENFFQYSGIKKIEAKYFDFTGTDSLTQYNSSGVQYAMFNGCKNLEEMEDLNIPADQYIATWYGCTSLKKIAIVRCKAGKGFNSTFGQCYALEDVTFTGTVSANGLDLQDSAKLNRKSIESLINVLSTTTSGLSVTLSRTAVNKAFETSAGANDGVSSAEWAALIATKSKWTISLV